MKNIRVCLFILFSVVFLILSNGTTANAMQTGFETSELSSKEKNNFISNIDFSLILDEPDKKGVICFDVNDQGMIAVGQNDFERKNICVYTSEGEFMYGYTFNCEQNFGLEFDGSNVNVCFVRSDVVVSLDTEGNILDVKKIQDSIDNSSYRTALLYSTTRTVGDTTYLIRNDMGILNWIAISFSQIVIVDATGAETVIYDVNSMQLTKMIVAISLICVLVFFAVAVIIRQFIKLRHVN